MTQGVRAGLIFPVSRVGRLLKRDRINTRIGRDATVVMTAVMEYIAHEIIELSISAAKDGHKKRIIPKHISLALANDDELAKLCGGSMISQGCVRPHIEEVLLAKKKGKKGEAS